MPPLPSVPPSRERDTAEHAHGTEPDPQHHDTVSDAAIGVQFRHVRTHAEFDACVALQEETWGAQFNERVPAALLKVSQRVGGVTAGAFDADNQLIGFVFGLTGVERGELVHWSDMLAVRTGYRDHGIGRHLKEFQCDAVSRLGVVRMYWTFDPLVARNAHLNLNRLGARVAEYIPDMYGRETSSTLHRGIGSDRFVVNWLIRGARPTPTASQVVPPDLVRASVVVNAPDSSGIPGMPDPAHASVDGLFRVAIPLDIEVVQATSIPRAAEWRAATRSALQWGLAHHYRIRGFYRDASTGYGYYVLSTTPIPARDR